MENCDRYLEPQKILEGTQIAIDPSKKLEPEERTLGDSEILDELLNQDRG